MENKLEFVKIDCGSVSYLIVNKGSRFGVLYANPMYKPHQFARTETLLLAYEMIKNHLRGRHQCVFSLRELLDKTSKIQVENFVGVKIV